MKKNKSGAVVALLLLIALAVGIIAIQSFTNNKPETTTIELATTDAKTENYKKIENNENDIYKGDLILVNAEHVYNFDIEPTLVSVYERKTKSYKVKDLSVHLADHVMEPLNNLLNNFYKEKKLNSVIVISGHRTFDYQQTLLDAKIESDGAVEAYKWVALPGASEHHTGLALDFSIYNDDGTGESYTGGGEYKWVNENAYKYGFIVRYAEEKSAITGISYEPWHFRYIGLPHSYLVTSKGICYEEYIDFLRGYKYGDGHLLVEYDGTQYEIYFAESGNVHVPTDAEYTVSGNNVDGFIVTVTR